MPYDMELAYEVTNKMKQALDTIVDTGVTLTLADAQTTAQAALDAIPPGMGF